MVYTTDLGPHGPRYVTRDQANQKINWSTPAPVNWLKEGEKARDDDAGKPPVVHIHEACDEAPTSPDILERLGNIEPSFRPKPPS